MRSNEEGCEESGGTLLRFAEDFEETEEAKGGDLKRAVRSCKVSGEEL